MRSLNWFRRRDSLQRRASQWHIGLWLLPILFVQAGRLDAADAPVVLPGTQALKMPGDIASDLVAGVDRFLLRKLEESPRRPSILGTYRGQDWETRMAEARRRLAHILGVRDSRMPFTAPELVATIDKPALIARTNAYDVFAVRWPVLADPAAKETVSITGEGLLLVPTNQKIVADIIAIPDADQTPEQIAGIAEGLPADLQFAHTLAMDGCRVIIPTLISREIQLRGNASLTHRELLYRPAFELGRHLIGYEVQKVLACVDWLARSARKPKNFGIVGYGEGGMLGLYAAALDTRIEATYVSGYFGDRRGLWEQPIDRNVFGLLNGFSDAELTLLIGSRTLYVESGTGPTITLPGAGGAPARLVRFSKDQVAAELDRAITLSRKLNTLSSRIHNHREKGPSSYCEKISLFSFLQSLGVPPVSQPQEAGRSLRMLGKTDPAARMSRQIAEIDRHNQRLLSESAAVRAEFMKGLDTSSLDKYQQSVERYRKIFDEDVIGRFDDPKLPANPRTRKVYDKEKWTGYEVVLDVFPDVIAYGILLLPKDLKPGEKRPVVVCQHGLEGRPKDTIEGDTRHYHDFAAKLAERGFITFAPQNLYIFQDRFRTLQRKANPLGKTLFSIMVPQHQQITDWLKTLPYVDGDRIGFYGLSYGGKSAMRIPPLVKNYCLSICSADFNEWVWKNASSSSPYSYVTKNEYEIFEFDLGSTFNYAEMAALIAPRPFMVERGHFDTVGPDEQVAFEFAKVRNLYAAKLGIGDRCEIEFFVGPHTINGKGTFDFLHKHLKWPKPEVRAVVEAPTKAPSAISPSGPTASPHPVTSSGALAPNDALRALKTLPDLEIQQVLAEPTVSQPVFLNFDERGRMWVVQYLQYPAPAGLKVLSHDYHWRAVYDKVPQPPPHHVRGADKITIHEDTDGDGVYDRHKTFVEGLNICTAVCRGRGGAWVLNPPYLLFYPDKNNDDVPDGDPEVHLAGFGLEDTHSVVNSLCWGPDGWLYAAQGSTVSGDVVRPGLDKNPVHTLGQLIWRYHPEQKRYEIFSEGGGNAFGCEIDSKGRVFSGHNGGNTRGFHYMQGAYLQKGFNKHGPLSNPFAFGYFPAMNHPAVPRFTHTFTLYEATSLPETHRGKLFGVAPLLNYVVESEMTAEGSTFKTRDVAFPIQSADPWFRPVDIKLGPDGALYVADWYDNQVAHLRSAEGQFDKSNGRIYRLQARGAKPQRLEDLGALTTAQLVERLRSDNRWIRQTALRLLGDRRDPAAIPLLKEELARRQTGQLALESLWALNLSGGLDEAAVIEGLDHPDPHVRLWTVRLACDDGRASSRIVAKMATLARGEPSIEVRAQLACSARRLPVADDLAIVKELLQHAEDADDPRQPLLLWWAIEAKCDQDRDAVLSFFTRLGIWELPLVDRHLASRLMRRFAASGTRKDLLTCARLFALAPSKKSAGRLMTGFEEAFQGRSLTGLPAELIAALSNAGGGSLPLRIRQGVPQAIQEGVAAIADAKRPPAERVGIVRLFGEIRDPSALMPLLKIAGATKEDLELRHAAMTSLAAYDDPQVATTLLSAFPELPKDLRRVALSVLVTRVGWTRQLLNAVAARRLAAKDVPTDIVLKILLHLDSAVGDAVYQHWGTIEGATTDEMRKQVTKLGRVIRSGTGDPYAGHALFQQSCAKCHQLFGQGGQIGPDLTSYKRDDIDRMLLNIVNPNAEIREGFENRMVITNDGRTLTGFLVDQDNQVIVLRNTEGQTTTIPRSNIDELLVQSRSLMPERLLQMLSDQQVCDLFAYLRSTQPLPNIAPALRKPRER